MNFASTFSLALVVASATEEASATGEASATEEGCAELADEQAAMLGPSAGRRTVRNVRWNGLMMTSRAPVVPVDIGPESRAELHVAGSIDLRPRIVKRPLVNFPTSVIRAMF